jgi:hypothetical protein
MVAGAVLALAPTAMQSWAGDPYVTIEREEDDVMTALAASALAAHFTAAMQLHP